MEEEGEKPSKCGEVKLLTSVEKGRLGSVLYCVYCTGICSTVEGESGRLLLRFPNHQKTRAMLAPLPPLLPHPMILLFRFYQNCYSKREGGTFRYPSLPEHVGR